MSKPIGTNNLENQGSLTFFSFCFSVSLISTLRQERSITKILLKIICTSVAGSGFFPPILSH